jgi:putative endonuclease
MRASLYCVYLLRCSDGSIYCGIATDLGRRVTQHNEGKGARYTAAHGPVSVEYATASRFSRAEAQAVELKVKRLRRAAKRGFLEKLEAERSIPVS